MKWTISVLLTITFLVIGQIAKADNAKASIKTKHLHPGLLVIVPLNNRPVFILNRRQSEIDSLRHTYPDSKDNVVGCTTCDPVFRSKRPEYLVMWGYNPDSGCTLVYASSTATDWVGHAVYGRGGFVDGCTSTEYDLSGRKLAGPASSPNQIAVPRYSIHDGIIDIFNTTPPKPRDNNQVKISISATPGDYYTTTLGEASQRHIIRTSMKLVKFNPSKEWPPAAYIGFYQGENKNDKSNGIQVVLIHNHPDDNYLVTGYRVIKDGKEVIVKSIKNLPIDSSLHVILRFVDGLVTLKIDNHKSIQIKTSLIKVSPYLSVSSGAADFEIRR